MRPKRKPIVVMGCSLAGSLTASFAATTFIALECRACKRLTTCSLGGSMRRQPRFLRLATTSLTAQTSRGRVILTPIGQYPGLRHKRPPTPHCQPAPEHFPNRELHRRFGKRRGLAGQHDKWYGDR